MAGEVRTPAREHDNEARIVELELRYMRQEKMLQDLSDVLVEQRRAIDRLTGELASLRERLTDPLGERVPNEPPPHY